MASRWGVTFGSLIASGSLAFLGSRFAPPLPLQWHRAMLGIAAGLVGALLSAASFAVFAKLDGMVKDSESFDTLQTGRLHDYIHAVRAGLIIQFVVAVVAALAAGAIALALGTADGVSTILQSPWVIPAGYMASAFILLYMLRVAYVYLQLDGFRRQVFLRVDAEKRRAAALKELRPSVVSEFPASKKNIERHVEASTA